MKSPKSSQLESIFFVCLLASLASLTTLKAVEIPVGLDVRRLFTVDMNYDGLDDLVVGGTDGVAILIADGHGGFEPPDPLSGAGLIGIADVNEDGFLDIITTTGVIFGSSGGRWSMGPTHKVPRPLDNVGGEVADFDKDGHIDFIVGETVLSGEYRIFYGDGTGNFTRDAAFRPIGEFLAAQDVDGNELPDIIQGSDDGKIFVYLNLGQRKWSAVATYSLPLSPGYVDRIYRPVVADFTGDGITDIMAGGYGLSKIYLFEGKGDGTYKDARSIAEFAHVGQLCVADFDKDGSLDVLASSYPIRGSTNLVMVLYGDPAGQFARQTVVPLGSSHIDAATGDYNSDGWQDIAVLSWTTDTVSILHNDGKGSFAVPPLFLEDAHVELAADFDKDGFKDILFTRDTDADPHLVDRNLFVAYGNANGTFAESQQLSHKDLPTGSGAFVVGYFDERLDASQDIETYGRLDVGFNYWYGTLYILLNRGGRVWSQPISAARNNGDEMVAGDFNEDGFQDIITNGDTFDPVTFLAGRGNGNFNVNYMELEDIQRLASADLDNDGHLDVVAPEGIGIPQNKRGCWIGWGKGNGSFDFVWDERIKAWANGHRIWLADINGDGLCDIVDVNPDQVMLNLGNRSFGSPLLFGGEPLDINGDGNLDILRTYSEEGCLIARFGDGNFGWSAPEVWIHGGQLSGINIFYGPPDDPVANVLVGRYYYGFWTHPNPWRGVSVADTYGPQILDYVGPLNPGFTIAPTQFVLRLSEPIDPATVHPDTVYLLSAGPDGLLGSSDDLKVNGNLSYDDVTWQIAFAPGEPLSEGPYRFVVSGELNSAISDLVGNALDGTAYDAFPSISGNGRPGGSFISTFYVVDSLPVPQQFDIEDDYVNGKPTSPQLIEFDSNRRATITATGSGPGSGDYGDTYFLGELNAGDVVTVDLDGSGAGLTHRGGTLSILRHLPEGWVTMASTCLTDGFIDPHLSFPVRYSGEYILAVYLGDYERIGRSTKVGTYSIDIAIDSASKPWGMTHSPQTVFLDFDGSQNSPWGDIEPFDAWQLDFDSARTRELIVSIVDKVKKDFAQFSNIVITSHRPAGVDYTRISIGLAWWIVDPEVDNWNLNHADEGLVNSYSFWEMRHYGLNAVAQAMANTITHQIGHLLGLQHIQKKVRRTMSEETPISYLVQDQSFGKGRYWWSTDFSIYTLPEQDDVHILEYNTGPTLPPPVPPTIGSLIAEPNSVKRGETFRLYAQAVNDVDGRVVKVEFYRDKNANTLLEIGIDEYLGTGSYSSSSKRWTRSVATSSYSAGAHIFLARAMDDDGAWSNVVSTTVTINEPQSPVAADGLSGARDP